MENTVFIKNLGRKIALLRKEQNLSQEEFAFKSGKMVNSISKLERGIGNPKISTLLDVASALNTDILNLLNINTDLNINYKRSNEKFINEIMKITADYDEKKLKVIVKQIKAMSEL